MSFIIDVFIPLPPFLVAFLFWVLVLIGIYWFAKFIITAVLGG